MTRFILGAATAAVMTILFAVLYLVTFPFDGRNRVFSFIAYHWSRAVFAATGVKVRTVGLEKIDPSRPHVFVSNHASLFDVIAVVIGISREIRFVAKKEIKRVPIFGLAVSKANIMVDRRSGLDGARSLEDASRRISRGDSFIIFAEGTRTRDGSLLPFKRGAFSLAIGAGVPVVPVTILGSYDVMRKGKLNVNPGVITIIVGSPIDTSGYQGRQGAFALMTLVRGIIQQSYAPFRNQASRLSVAGSGG